MCRREVGKSLFLSTNQLKPRTVHVRRSGARDITFSGKIPRIRYAECATVSKPGEIPLCTLYSHTSSVQ